MKAQGLSFPQSAVRSPRKRHGRLESAIPLAQAHPRLIIGIAWPSRVERGDYACDGIMRAHSNRARGRGLDDLDQ
jgi:hypothetical protein